MSSCTAAEIAEKKRIALEKLRAKKQLSSNGDSGNKPPISQPTTAKIISNDPSPAAVELVAKPGINFYKSSENSSRYTSATATSNENKASTFLNALKESSVFTHRRDVREAAHPYQRPALKQTTSHQPLLTLSPQKPSTSLSTAAVTCKVYMTTAFRFAVHPSGYHNKLIEVFKTIPSKTYAKNTRIWSFALKDYKLLQQRVSGLKPNVVIGVIPKCVLNLCQAPVKEIDRSYLNLIEPNLALKLLPFQEEGVCFSIAQHGRIMICDEMGLGKTYQALAIADYYKEDWPLLICTTASTRDSWSTHIRELLPSIPLHSVQRLLNNQEYVGDARVLITSYNMMEKHYTKLLERKFSFIIFDESHTLKNQKAKTTVVADRLAMQAKHIVLLSGTPALSRPVELFTQLQMIDRKFMNFVEFTSRYCDAKKTNFGWDASGQSNLEELNVVLKLKYMIRRTKAEVLPQLAQKYRETIVLDPALIWLDDAVKETHNEFTKTLNSSKGRIREEILLKFYAETARVKTRAVCAYLKTLIKEKIKFIVFAHHHVMLNAITEFLFKAKVCFVRIDGSTRNEIRAENIDMFQTQPSCRVAVLSLKACNSGITLTAAEIIVFAELDWNPSTLAQAESRAHRIGQDKPVICRYLMANKTADDIIWNMLKSKQDVLNRAGLFCENLQEATHSAAPTMSPTIDKYFSPEKVSHANDADMLSPKQVNTSSTVTSERVVTDELSVESTNTNNMSLDLRKELENIDEFFMDDDDDAFRNLVF